MQHDLPFEPPSSPSPSPSFLSASPERDEAKHPFDNDLMNVNSYLPSFIQPGHQPAPSDMSLLHSPLPSSPSMNSSLPPEPYFQKSNEEPPYGRTQREASPTSTSPPSTLSTSLSQSSSSSTPSNGVGPVAGGGGTSLSGNVNGPADKVVMQTLNVDLLKLALGSKTGKHQLKHTPIDILPSLSRPAFIPGDRPTRFRFVLGTEEQNPQKLSDNKIIFGQLTHDPAHNVTRVHVHITYPIPDHVRDMQWVDPLHTVFAIGAKLGIASLNPTDFTVQELTMFPQFHSDIVREIALSQNCPNLVLSGGFDGKVFVTDISRLYVDIQKNEQKSENSLYPCSDVVGSVRWHPTDAYLASCTTDPGTLHIFDIRTDKKRPALIYHTSKRNLYSHDYRDQHTLLLGFGDGQVQVFDSRTRKNLIVFQDPYLKAVGDIRFNRLSKHFAFFGIPEFTLWQYNDNEMRLWTHHYLSARPNALFDGVYKTNGEFLPSTAPAIAVTDSCGMFAVYSLS